MKRLGTNAMIFLVAVLFSVVLFYFVENPNLFSASVISLKEKQIMQENLRDIGYKNENQVLDVFLSSGILDINYVSLSIIYDENQTTINLDQLKPQTQYELLSNKSGSVLIKFSSFADFDYDQSLFELPFESETNAMLLSEGTVVFIDGNTKSLSIGLFNSQGEKDYHGF